MALFFNFGPNIPFNPAHIFLMILVPTDFTSVGDCALNHALLLAGTTKTSIGLLHIVEKEKDEPEALKKLNAIISSLPAGSGVAVEPITRVGNIFDDIGAVAKERKARFIIMGTHGVTGFQHITGSHALKVITNAALPFIVVQNRNIRSKGYERIVCPIDLTVESKQKIDLTIQVAKYFNSKVWVVSPHETDEFLVNTVRRNLAFAEAQFKSNGIECETKMFEEKGNFVKQTLRFAAGVDADLMTIINGQEPGVYEYIAGTEERQFITNETQIPVMCINPVNVTREGSVLFFK